MQVQTLMCLHSHILYSNKGRYRYVLNPFIPDMNYLKAVQEGSAAVTAGMVEETGVGTAASEGGAEREALCRQQDIM